MDALISRRGAGAVLLLGDSFAWIGPEDTDQPVPLVKAALHLALDDTHDFEGVENTSLEDIRRLLRSSRDSEEALHLILMLLDRELPRRVRQDAAQACEELLIDTSVKRRLKSTLYAQPLPGSGDLAGALGCCAASCVTVADMLNTLRNSQRAIREVGRAWDAMPASAFDSEETRELFRAAAVQQGLFRDFVENRTSEKSTGGFVAASLLNPVIRMLPNFRTVLLQWSAPWRRQIRPSIPKNEEPHGEPKTARRREHRRIDRLAVLESVERQKKAITNLMRRAYLPRMWKFVNDLVEYQLERGEPEFASKSLCDLAMRAKTLQMHPTQLELTEKALELTPDDGWAWAQYADALRNTGQAERTLKAYDEAALFGQHQVAANGRAEALKTLGRLEEALAAYQKTITEHPEDLFARNGRAETLRTSGRLEEALAAYQKTITEFPWDTVAKSGRANTLKVMNRFDDALEAYDAIVAEYAWDAVARNGLASVLAAMGAHDRALAHLPVGDPVTADDWIALHIRGMIFLQVDRIEEAIQIFERGVQFSLQPSQRDYFRTGLALGHLLQRNYQSAAGTLAEIRAPELTVPASVLRLHTFGLLRDRDRAMQAYLSASALRIGVCAELTEELHHRYIADQEPSHSDEWLVDHEVRCLLLAA